MQLELSFGGMTATHQVEPSIPTTSPRTQPTSARTKPNASPRTKRRSSPPTQDTATQTASKASSTISPAANAADPPNPPCQSPQPAAKGRLQTQIEQLEQQRQELLQLPRAPSNAWLEDYTVLRKRNNGTRRYTYRRFVILENSRKRHFHIPKGQEAETVQAIHNRNQLKAIERHLELLYHLQKRAIR
jgi:hypothetical protein